MRILILICFGFSAVLTFNATAQTMPIEGAIQKDDGTISVLKELIKELENEAASKRGQIGELETSAPTMNDTGSFDIGGVWSSIDEGRLILLNKDRLKEGEQAGIVYVFISFSMPDQMIIDYMAEADKAGAVVVIRGLIEDPEKPGKVTLKKTSEYLQNLLKDGNMGGVSLDPNAFTAFRIEVVPTFVSALEVAPPGLERGQNVNVPHDKLSGAVSLKFALKTLAEKGTVAPFIAQSRLKQLMRKDTGERTP
ncbi:MAG: type-F conjugative transfer system pilin assembly protein TrbC [Robiginitomaculum sp.]|nr:MAG: type-F conjugative transfer system pilin assembly protein TrbC [Robiginitomaculum sp.]